MLYDLETQQQTVLADLNAGWPCWSHDGQFVYFMKARGDTVWCRVRVRDRKLEYLASLKAVKFAPFIAVLDRPHARRFAPCNP